MVVNGRDYCIGKELQWRTAFKLKASEWCQAPQEANEALVLLSNLIRAGETFESFE